MNINVIEINKSELTFDEFIEAVSPVFPILFGALFEPDQSALDVLVARTGSESKSWIAANSTVFELPLGHTLINSLVEYQQH